LLGDKLVSNSLTEKELRIFFIF